MVAFNVEDVGLAELVRFVSNLTGKRFIMPGKVPAIKATVLAPTKVTVSEAFEAFLSVLGINGLAVVPSGSFLKIEAIDGVDRTTLPLEVGGQPPPFSGRFITRIHHLDHVGSEDVAGLLQRYTSGRGSIVAYQPTNMLLITGTAQQVSHMLTLVEAVDLPSGTTQIWLERVHHANASDLASRLLEIVPAVAGDRGDEQTGIRNIVADERTNSLIIVASERAYLRILDLIRRLDVSLQGEGRLHVHHVQHGSASDLAGALTGILGSVVPRSSPTGTKDRGRGPRPPDRPTGAPPALVAGSLLDGDVVVTAYEPTNALLITSTSQDYAALRHVIERLDAPRKQVFIEAVLMELAVERASDVGVAFHGAAGNFPTNGSLAVAGFNPAASIDVTQNDLTGLALGVRGPTINNSQQLVGVSVPAFGVAVTALARTGDADVLSTPHIIAMDNAEAEISIGENIPLQTNAPTPASGGGALAELAAGAGTVARQDVGTTIRIVPHINENDEVRLEIEEEISEQGVTSGTLGVVSINRRTARTQVMVRDQQTIVIGGLMRDAVQDTESKVPALGDAPVVGALFRRTNKRRRKTNLLLILTPYIVRDPADIRAIFERKLQERQQVIDRYFVFGEDEFEPHIDYSRTRGLVAEIINEIDSLEKEEIESAATKGETPQEHAPGAPIGSSRASNAARAGGAPGSGQRYQRDSRRD
ncbi:MAG: type II secretion system secretin GspD [Myxococcota bacterium]